MQRYARYKDSGIEWIGEIPAHWEVIRTRHIAEVYGRIGYRGYKVTDLVSEGEGAITISPSNMKDFSMKFDNCTYLSWEKYEESPEIKIYNGDVLFVKTGSTYGKTSYVDKLPGKATINPQIVVFKNIRVNTKLFWYIFKSINISYQVERTVVGGTIPTIAQSRINNYRFPFPENDREQTAIATYLDRKTAEIDQLIADKKRLVELYQEEKTAIINQAVTKGINPNAPMKDSGIEWLGEVPAHWEVSRMKNISRVRQGLQIPVDKRLMAFEEGAMEYITIRSINNPTDMKQYVLNPPQNVICIEDDILMARTGATGIPITNVKGVFHNNFFLVDFNRKKVDKMYLFYYLKCSSIYEYLLLVAGTTTIPDLNHGAFYSTPFYEFDKREQIQIVQHIEKASQRIDAKITKAQKYITLLTEYRTALISEVVTGKVKVTDE